MMKASYSSSLESIHLQLLFGILRYPPPYAQMIRTPFPPRMPILPLSRPPVPLMRGPIMPLVVRPPGLLNVPPVEKPQPTAYVGHLASTVDNDFILSLLNLCGPVKTWKRAQDPSNGSLKGYGFCEFESAEGVLRAMRLLSKLNVDGQELLINVSQATREYLERFVDKKTDNSKMTKETESQGAETDEGKVTGDKKDEPPNVSAESEKDGNDARKDENNNASTFGIVTEEDREADQEALEKLTNLMEERLKNNPLPPPPPPPPSAPHYTGNSNSEPTARLKDGESDAEMVKHDTMEETTGGDIKQNSEHDQPEPSSPDGIRRHDRRSRDRDRERDFMREREEELHKKERTREQERAWRDKERESKTRDEDRKYNARVADWERKLKDKDYYRQEDKDKEKEKEKKRKRLIEDQERENDDGDSRKRRHKYIADDRRRRQREKEDDLADALREEEELARAKIKAEEELQQQKEQQNEALVFLPSPLANGSDKSVLSVEKMDIEVKVIDDTNNQMLNLNGGGSAQYGNHDDIAGSAAAPAKKLGFGLVGSGKRTTVLSVFNEEEDEESRKDKKMRPLVPIDYSKEEQQAVQTTTALSPNLAAEVGKHVFISPKPEKFEERSRHNHDRTNHRDRGGRYDNRDEKRKDDSGDREHGSVKEHKPDTRKLKNAKQLIDMIPKTKDELFSYEINWAVYDKNKLHDRMKPWISKKITEFLGEEETTLVDYIVQSTQKHVNATEMLENLQGILDEEAEMFVLKMWRMLIFEIKKIESGLALSSK
ncbi:RNA-binding protein 25 isoform X2 [Impatiens glandulifera]|uniref:RNA-binding protein 25 isoform X2 n=1 Tax=Impatiens glandulifera TaxID=253017 RepID=UPI001FB04ED8|nr:RNA-binding protein 25 isoform X2 [Impatiens glandulifera]XP_047321270.1 RNA-binding protein 25 isoform X2 [Impatiens glandulifera]